MAADQLRFSVNQIRIEGLEELKSEHFLGIPETNPDHYVIDGEIVAVETVERGIFDERYVSLHFVSGQRYPYPDTVFDAGSRTTVANPRAEGSIELDQQDLYFIDCEEQVIYLSNQKKASHIEKWLSEKLKKIVTIKLLMDEAEFIKNIRSVSTVSFTADSSPDADRNTLAGALSADAYGYGAKRASLTLSYEKTFSSKIQDGLGRILDERKAFRKITVCGRTDDDVEAVFNTDRLVYKIPMDTAKDDITGRFNHIDAFNSLMLKIKRKEI